MTLKLSPKTAPKKLLLATAERVGDALFVTPGIKLLKQSLPDTQLDVLAFSKLAGSVFLNNPHVGEIHIASMQNPARKIASHYPMTINLMSEMNKKMGEMPENFYTIGLPDESKHRTQQVIDYVSSFIEIPKTQVDREYVLIPQAEDIKSVENKLKSLGCNLAEDILIGMQLGCHRVARRGWKIWNRKRHIHKKVWPIENYINLAQQLKASNPRIKIVLTGADSEKFMANIVHSKVSGIIDMIGKTNLFEVAALMDLLKVYITHDTGTLHIACSRGTPLVALFGPTPVEFTGPHPMKPQYSILKKAYMGDITVDEVMNEVLAKL